jgi:hypothetical protein
MAHKCSKLFEPVIGKMTDSWFGTYTGTRSIIERHHTAIAGQLFDILKHGKAFDVYQQGRYHLQSNSFETGNPVYGSLQVLISRNQARYVSFYFCFAEQPGRLVRTLLIPLPELSADTA